MKKGGSAALAAMIRQKSTMLYGDSSIEGTTSTDKEPAQPAEQPKVEKYQPTTTKFSGANQCFICNKTVYKMEEVIAVGKVWHDSCFTCGGCNDDGCKRVLKRDGYTDHNSMPYCKACFSKNFKPQGFGYGSSLTLDNGKPATEETKAAPVPLPPAPPAPAVPMEPVSKPTPPPPAPIATPPAPPAVKPVAPPVASPSTSSKPEAAPVKYSPKVIVNAFNSTPKCTICAKSVYKMEEMIAVGRIWHANCFTCGGSSSEGCKKVLRRDGYVDHENNPFCNACHSKLYKPKGVGYGATLNTDYGPAPDVPQPPKAADVPTAAVASISLASSAAPAPKAVAPPAPPVASPSQQPPKVSSAAPNGKAALNIGGTSKSAGAVFKEASYVGDNDEVDEAEWN